MEIVVPQFLFTLSKTMGPPQAPLDEVFLGYILAAQGKVNLDTVDATVGGIPLHFEPGELFCFGMVGTQKGTHALDWQGRISIRFGQSPNLTDVHLEGLPIFDKNGWEYVWITYEENVDPTPKQVVPKALQVNVDKLYYDENMQPIFDVIADDVPPFPPDDPSLPGEPEITFAPP